MEYYFEARGKRWNLSAISAGDLTAFADWVQMKPYDDLRRRKDAIDPESYQIVATELLRQCMKNPIKVYSEQYTDVMETPDGTIYMIYLSLKHKHPTIKPEEVSDLVPFQELAEIMAQISAVSGWITDEDLKKSLQAMKTAGISPKSTIA